MSAPAIVLEAVIDSVEAAIAAEAAGADRLELCTAFELGGLSPSAGLMDAVRAAVRIPVYALLRPRGGDFVFSAAELAVTLREIAYARTSGMDGVVIGALDAQGLPVMDWLRACKAAAGDMALTFHRAFDRVAAPSEVLEMLIQVGCDRVLTSGGAASALQGLDQLHALQQQAAGRIGILPGAGISPANALHIATTLGTSELHFSGICKATRQWDWARRDAAMGQQEADQGSSFFVPDPDKVAAMRACFPQPI
jgi:copper homeostasis protein